MSKGPKNLDISSFFVKKMIIKYSKFKPIHRSKYLRELTIALEKILSSIYGQWSNSLKTEHEARILKCLTLRGSVLMICKQGTDECIKETDGASIDMVAGFQNIDCTYSVNYLT